MAVEARAARLGAIHYETETNWGENTNTFGTRLAIRGAVDPSGLTHAKLENNLAVVRANDGHHQVLGVKGGSFRTRHWLTGHGSATTGSISATDLAVLLGLAIGANDASSEGTTASGGTATLPTLNGGTFADGALCRIGAAGDARGEGQFYRVKVGTAGTFELENDMSGAPNSGDVVYAPEMVYVLEDPDDVEVTGLRFLLQTANQRYACHGCFARSVTFSGWFGIVEVEIEWGVSWFAEHTSDTWPPTATHQTFYPQPAGRGSLVIQDVGTSTRQTFTPRDVALRLEMDITELPAIDGIDEHQRIGGVARTRVQPMLDLTFDAEDAAATPTHVATYERDQSDAYEYVMYTHNTKDGRAVGIWMPKATQVDPRPVQNDVDGLNRVRVTYKGLTGDTTDSDIEQAALILPLG